MPLQHLQALSVFQADNVIGEHGFPDRHRRLRLDNRRRGHFLDIRQGVINRSDRAWKRRGGDFIVGDMGGNNLRGQCQYSRVRRLFSHLGTSLVSMLSLDLK